MKHLTASDVPSNITIPFNPETADNLRELAMHIRHCVDVCKPLYESVSTWSSIAEIRNAGCTYLSYLVDDIFKNMLAAAQSYYDISCSIDAAMFKEGTNLNSRMKAYASHLEQQEIAEAQKRDSDAAHCVA